MVHIFSGLNLTSATILQVKINHKIIGNKQAIGEFFLKELGKNNDTDNEFENKGSITITPIDIPSISTKDVTKAMRKLKARSSTGVDNIPN